MFRSRKNRKLHKDNRGSGLIMVLIMVAFLSLLSAILLFASYGGYKMRLLDKQNTDNFYTVETVLDEINVGLQQEVSDALTVAYKDIMVNYSLYDSPEARAQQFYILYYNELLDDLAIGAAPVVGSLSGAGPYTYDINRLRGYLSSELFGDGASADGSRANFGNYGAIVECSVEPESYSLLLGRDGMVFKNLKVSYVNERGFISIITTDIRIGLPQVNFSQSSEIPDLNRFCLIANSGLIAGNTDPLGKIVFEGDVYADSMSLGKQSDTDFTGGYNFTNNTEITFKAPANPDPAATEPPTALVVSKNAVEVKDITLKTTDIDFWGKNILLDSATIDFTGDTYVKNDLKLEGTGSEAALAGTYTGFGTGLDDADSSSAIVVNGRDSSLDLSNLQSLNISGHSFIATGSQPKDNSVHDEDDVRTDVLMGESVAIKSNQLVYLIPPEAIGCEILPDGSVGESVFRSNPMKREHYQEIKNNPSKYQLLDVTRPLAALGGESLDTYMEQVDISGGGKEYRPIVIVKQNSAGESLVYCYMMFKDEKMANKYFADYYGVNEESVKKFTRIYADAIKMPSDMSNMLYLHLAGNVLAYEGNNYNVTSATDDPGEKMHAEELALVRSEMFNALSIKMVTNMSQISMAEQGRSVFYNIIDETKLRPMVGLLKTGIAESSVIVPVTGGSKAAVLSTGDYIIDSTTIANNVKLVVCLGDVRVKTDFEGAIIAEGKVIVGDEENVDNTLNIKAISVEEFTELLKAFKTKDGTDYYVLDVFKDGANYANMPTSVTDHGTHEVSLSDLIVYEHWSKK